MDKGINTIKCDICNEEVLWTEVTASANSLVVCHGCKGIRVDELIQEACDADKKLPIRDSLTVGECEAMYRAIK